MCGVALAGCATTPTNPNWVSDPSDPNNVKIEAAIRKAAENPEGALTQVDLEKVTKLYLSWNRLTDVKGLEKLTQLKVLNLSNNKLTNLKSLEKLTQLKELDLYRNPALTKAQIAELKEALPKCKIESNPTK